MGRVFINWNGKKSNAQPNKVQINIRLRSEQEERASENLNEGCSAKSNLERLLCNSRSSKVIADDYFKFVLACNRAAGV